MPVQAPEPQGHAAPVVGADANPSGNPQPDAALLPHPHVSMVTPHTAGDAVSHRPLAAQHPIGKKHRWPAAQSVSASHAAAEASTRSTHRRPLVVEHATATLASAVRTQRMIEDGRRRRKASTAPIAPLIAPRAAS